MLTENSGKYEILAYLVENDFDLGNMTMDEWATAYTVEELWGIVQYMLGQAEDW